MRDAISIWSRLILVALATLAGIAMAADRQLGVGTCAGSTCHGATRAFADRTIRQDEYFVWQNQDHHSRAYRSLQAAPAAAIARRLGLKSAEKAPQCLACHGAPPPEAERGARYRVEDGVGCETCHGAAERWLTPHAAGFQTMTQRRAAGLAPTWELAPRARLCLSCHQGDAERPVTHALMAAGHPALLFELDTFMGLMPPHHAADADYLARKPAVDPAQQWLEGQLAAAEGVLARLAQPAEAGARFPDFARYDCDACHHPMSSARATAGRVPGQPVGTVPLADQPLVLLAAWLEAVDPALGQRWREGLGRIYAGLSAGDASAALAAQGKLLAEQLRPRAAGLPSARELRGVLRRVLATGAATHGGDLRYAEQVAMASTVLGAALHARGESLPGFKTANDALYAQLARREAFDPTAWREACRRLEKAL